MEWRYRGQGCNAIIILILLPTVPKLLPDAESFSEMIVTIPDGICKC